MLVHPRCTPCVCRSMDHGQRQCMLWAMTLKFLAVVTLKQNAAFWGPCTTDSGKEAKEQHALAMKQMGVTSTGALAAQIGV